MSKHVLITGATRGIGRACADLFLAANWAVTAVARTATDLAAMKKEYPGAQLTTVAVDLSSEAGAEGIPAVFYDVVLLNAAAFAPGPLLGEEDLYEHLQRVNVLANHRLARRLLPLLRARGAGHLVVIGSRGTDFQPEHLTAYVATKYALRGLFLGWAAELSGSGVRATLVAPGATLTSSWDDEEPPADILMPEAVAEVVWEVVREEREGRVVV